MVYTFTHLSKIPVSVIFRRNGGKTVTKANFGSTHAVQIILERFARHWRCTPPKRRYNRRSSNLSSDHSRVLVF
jgi:hypothetical protein